MRLAHRVDSWVVYERTVKGAPSGTNVVCEQSEWAALNLDAPGVHTLVQSGIPNEAEAERLARSATPALRACPRRYR